MNTFDAEYEAAQDKVIEAILIDESNLAAHLNHYDDYTLINLLSSGKKFLRLKDGIGYRLIEAEDICIQVAADEQLTVKLIAHTRDGDTPMSVVRDMVNQAIYKHISAALDQIKEDWSELIHKDLGGKPW